ncbi:MAG: glutamyl-tRNA reductase [Gemmatimonadaceae bacterium]
MALIVAGMSHRTASVEVRERFAYATRDIPDALGGLVKSAGAREGVLVSTCNRTEIYMVEGPDDGAESVWRSWSERLGAEAAGFGYVHYDRDAVRHVFRVASGLDSMILGEPQIHGQVRDAWEQSRTHSGVVLNRLFHTSLQVASRVREETGLGRGAASISSAAVQLAKQIFGSLAGRRVMVLGAGDNAEIALECMVGEGVRAAVVANRTHDRAVELAGRYGATALTLDECWASLHDVDVVICSTSAPHVVVTADTIRAVVASRAGRPLCVLDIAVPRDVDPAVRDLANVYLYDIDDLHAVVDANLQRRRDRAAAAEDIIAGEVERFWNWLAGLEAVPVLRRFRTEMDRLRERELSGALRRMGELTPEQLAAVDHLTRSLMNKFLHEPTVRLRAAAANGRGLGVVDSLRYLFALSDDEHPAEAVETHAPPGEANRTPWTP